MPNNRSIKFEWNSEISQIDRRAFTRLGRFGGRQYQQSVADNIIRFSKNAHNIYAKCDRGFIGYAKILNDCTASSWLAQIAVLPEWQGQGIGQTLMEQINVRFARSSLYTQCPSSLVNFFTKHRLKPKPKLTACYRPQSPFDGETLISSEVDLTYSVDRPPYQLIESIYESIGWGESGQNAVERCFTNSDYTLFAYSGEELVGFARALEDGAQTVWLSELCVSAPHQRKGVGRCLLLRVIEQFSDRDIFAEALTPQRDFFDTCGLPLRQGFTACSRAPLQDMS